MSKEALESVQKILSTISILTIKHLFCSTGAFIFIKTCYQNTNTQTGCLEKTKNCFAVYALIECLNYQFYKAHENEAVLKIFPHDRVPF